MSVVLMHAQGEPKTMQDDPRYDDVVLEVFDYLEERIAAARQPASRLRASPPIPASASARRSRTTSRCSSNTSLFHGLGVPLLIGASRKRFIQGLAGGRGTALPRAGLSRRRHRRREPRGANPARPRRGGHTPGARGVAGFRVRH